MADSSNAIIIYDKRLLLLLRDNTPGLRDANKWSLIGGARESQETYDEALMREVEEEISIKPKDVNYLGKVKTSDGTHAIYYIRLSEDEKEDIALGDEGQKLDFFTVKEMEKIELTKNLDWYFDKHKDYLAKVVRIKEIPDPEQMDMI